MVAGFATDLIENRLRLNAKRGLALSALGNGRGLSAALGSLWGTPQALRDTAADRAGAVATGRGGREHHAAAGKPGDRDRAGRRRPKRARHPVCQRLRTF